MNTTKKTCPVILLPTKQTFNSLKGYLNGSLLFDFKEVYTTIPAEEGITGHFNMYILSDEDIKEGEYYFNPIANCINQCESEKRERLLRATKHNGYKKVIASTDLEIIRKKVYRRNNKGETLHQDARGTYEWVYVMGRPPKTFIQEFIEAYNIGKPINEVLVDYEVKRAECVKYECNCGGTTYDELNINPEDKTITITKLKDTWTNKERLRFAIEFADHCLREAGVDASSIGEMLKFDENWLNKKI